MDPRSLIHDNRDIIYITVRGLCLVNQTKLLCDREGTPNHGKNARCVEIGNKVIKVMEDNLIIVQVWWEWCKTNDVNMVSQSAVEAFDRLYQEAINHPERSPLA
jgi:hypothetical protein